MLPLYELPGRIDIRQCLNAPYKRSNGFRIVEFTRMIDFRDARLSEICILNRFLHLNKFVYYDGMDNTFGVKIRIFEVCFKRLFIVGILAEFFEDLLQIIG